eukprot:COSAG02_NODE_1428_length_12662_cov_12.695137_3_plen_284_part_00
MQRVGVRAVRTGARGFHCTPAASAAISFNSVISKVSNEADKARLINLQKVHDGAKGALHGVKDTAESIDFAEWSAKIGDAATVAEIKAAYEAVTLPSASDTTMVDHPAWDQNEFAKLSASLGLQNEETAADLSKLKAYQQYLKDMPAVSEMTVEDVLGKNSALDYQVQRQMDEMEVLPPPPPPHLFLFPPPPFPRSLASTHCTQRHASIGSVLPCRTGTRSELCGRGWLRGGDPACCAKWPGRIWRGMGGGLLLGGPRWVPVARSTLSVPYLPLPVSCSCTTL